MLSFIRTPPQLRSGVLRAVLLVAVGCGDDAQMHGGAMAQDAGSPDAGPPPSAADCDRFKVESLEAEWQPDRSIVLTITISDTSPATTHLALVELRNPIMSPPDMTFDEVDPTHYVVPLTSEAWPQFTAVDLSFQCKWQGGFSFVSPPTVLLETAQPATAGTVPVRLANAYD